MLSLNSLKPLLSGEALISFPKPSKSTTAARTLQLILQKYGWELGWVILTMMGANSYIVESSEKARDDVASGITGLAPTVLVYGIRAEIESGGNAKFIAAKNGVLPDISPVALAKDTRNKEAALAFIKWLLSPEGQRALAELFYYLPYIKPEDTLLGRIYEDVSSNIFNYDPEEASRWERSVIYYFEAAIADPDTNTLLKKVWVKALELYSRGLLSRDDLLRIQGELGKPLTLRIIVETRDFTREYAIEINKSIAEDTLFRDKFMDSIKRAAIERYNSILRELERIG
ncbi:MAG: extracellular solute-binding protein [Acidilobaceae archaeon]